MTRRTNNPTDRLPGATHRWTWLFGVDWTLHDTVALAPLGIADTQGTTYITGGPWAGNFSSLESQTSTLVIFRRP